VLDMDALHALLTCDPPPPPPASLQPSRIQGARPSPRLWSCRSAFVALLSTPRISSPHAPLRGRVLRRARTEAGGDAGRGCRGRACTRRCSGGRGRGGTGSLSCRRSGWGRRARGSRSSSCPSPSPSGRWSRASRSPSPSPYTTGLHPPHPERADSFHSTAGAAPLPAVVARSASLLLCGQGRGGATRAGMSRGSARRGTADACGAVQGRGGDGGQRRVQGPPGPIGCPASASQPKPRQICYSAAFYGEAGNPLRPSPFFAPRYLTCGACAQAYWFVTHLVANRLAALARPSCPGPREPAPARARAAPKRRLEVCSASTPPAAAGKRTRADHPAPAAAASRAGSWSPASGDGGSSPRSTSSSTSCGGGGGWPYDPRAALWHEVRPRPGRSRLLLPYLTHTSILSSLPPDPSDEVTADCGGALRVARGVRPSFLAPAAPLVPSCPAGRDDGCIGDLRARLRRRRRRRERRRRRVPRAAGCAPGGPAPAQPPLRLPRSRHAGSRRRRLNPGAPRRAGSGRTAATAGRDAAGGGGPRDAVHSAARACRGARLARAVRVAGGVTAVAGAGDDAAVCKAASRPGGARRRRVSGEAAVSGEA
jgi:hypothetical protein